MKTITKFILFFIPIIAVAQSSIYDIKVKTIDNEEISLSKYKDRVMLIVNVASKCGYTYQYEGLQKLHEKYEGKGLSILGFPCNQFLSQEPGTEEEIKEFCSLNFNVKFDMFSKIDVNGDNTHPLYELLKEKQSGILGTSIIKWNFTKFLVDKEGNVVKRYSPSTEPSEIEKDIVGLL